MSNRSRKEYRHLFSLIKERRARYVFGVVGSGLLNGFISIIMAYAMMEMIAAVMNGQMRSLWAALYAIGSITLIVGVVSPFCQYWYQTSVKKNMASLRRTGYEKLVNLPMAKAEQLSKGNMNIILNQDIQRIEQTFTEHTPTLLYMLTLGIGSVIVMFVLDWRFAAILVMLTLITFVVSRILSRSIRKDSDKLQQQMDGVGQTFSELLSGALVLRLFPAAGSFRSRFEQQSRNAARLTVSQTRKSGLLEAINYVVNFLSFGGVIALGTLLVLRGSVQIETIVALVQLQTNINFAFNQWSRYVAGVQLSLTSLERVRTFLDDESEDLAGRVPAPGAPYDVQIGIVQYSYDKHTSVLHSLDIDIPEGSTIAFVGQSGSGKSTLAKLLLGLYRDYEGSIKIAGMELRDWSLPDLRDRIAYVPQQTYLFDGTIEDNIRAGNDEAPLSAVMDAAQKARIRDFIDQLPDGLQTRVNEGGQFLSGGQKQRIALARMFLKGAPIILLDEPTSALDAKNEEQFQESLLTLPKGKTIIVIAHRLSTVQHADRIYVMQHGRITEQGTHMDLMQANGVYAGWLAGRTQAGS